MKYCYCSYCDAEPLIDGIQFGYSVSFNVGLRTSRIGMYVGAIKAGSPYPASKNALTYEERSFADNMQDSTKFLAIEDGVFVLENLGEQYSLRKPVYVPNSSVTLFKSVAREVRERSEPEKYEPKWDEPNPTRVAARRPRNS